MSILNIFKKKEVAEKSPIEQLDARVAQSVSVITSLVADMEKAVEQYQQIDTDYNTEIETIIKQTAVEVESLEAKREYAQEQAKKNSVIANNFKKLLG